MSTPSPTVEPSSEPDHDQLLGFTPTDQQWERRTRISDWFGRLFLIGMVVVLGGGAVFLISAFSRWSPISGPALPPPFVIPALTPDPGSAIPSQPQPAPSPTTAPLSATSLSASNAGQASETLPQWVHRVSTKTDIPERVLLAYANAELALKKTTPSCHLTWATLAGVGRAESQHGMHDGAVVNPDGVESKPIIGVALDGSPGVLAVPDTDHGELDNDSIWDHAVGPMQFTPETWRKWGVRASGDGKQPDPQNIDDATLTAGRYLCARGGDLAVPKKWWVAVLVYNNSTVYGQEVFSSADAYAKASFD